MKERATDFNMMFGTAEPAVLLMIDEITEIEKEVEKCREQKLQSA